ncbi:hypothetical protein K432DRAFT_224872 [Lepidopterella palustris CBS 459.81]|uniref:Uncharacterized protein n=1 Tax=Lepidopterella palustris CBS 459.81 TaxID=1314670 RepID=A0A8E2DY24_9PEZI|nr:hypothetical protein K432DRAFT_224872 [Lepidopterella palustris CBS 459.81]
MLDDFVQQQHMKIKPVHILHQAYICIGKRRSCQSVRALPHTFTIGSSSFSIVLGASYSSSSLFLELLYINSIRYECRFYQCRR